MVECNHLCVEHNEKIGNIPQIVDGPVAAWEAAARDRQSPVALHRRHIPSGIGFNIVPDKNSRAFECLSLDKHGGIYLRRTFIKGQGGRAGSTGFCSPKWCARHLTTCTRLLLSWCVVMGFAAATAMGQSASARGKGSAALPSDRTITIHWEQVPLREAVPRLSKALGRTIWVDRRIDPNRRISLVVRDATGAEVLEQLGSELSLGVSQLDPVVYLGPRQTAEQLRTVATLRHAEVRRLSSSRRRVLEQRQRLSWPRLTEPRSLIIELLRENGWTIRGAELIPYDLWPAGELPAMSQVDQLTILLAGFDLTFQSLAGQNAIEIKPIEEPVTLLKRYRWRADRMPDLDVLKRQLPGAKLRIEGGRLVLDGRVEDHERLLELLGNKAPQPSRPAPSPNAEQRYTLRVENQPVGEVLRQLAERLRWNLIIDEASIRAAGRSLDKQVSFAVEDVALDDLLEALLQPAGLTYQQEGQQITIVPGTSQE